VVAKDPTAAPAESQGVGEPKCPRCMGTGEYQRLPGDLETECAVCSGTGEVPDELEVELEQGRSELLEAHAFLDTLGVWRGHRLKFRIERALTGHALAPNPDSSTPSPAQCADCDWHGCAGKAGGCGCKCHTDTAPRPQRESGFSGQSAGPHHVGGDRTDEAFQAAYDLKFKCECTTPCLDCQAEDIPLRCQRCQGLVQQGYFEEKEKKL
jgi:hypothetical protein